MSPNLDNVLKKASKAFKSEVNFLYTAPPFNTSTGIDMGWFCREHAFHTATLLAVLGFRPFLVCGQFSLAFSGISARSDTSNGDHWWVSCDNITPIDFSITVANIPNAPPGVFNGPLIQTPATDSIHFSYSTDKKTFLENINPSIDHIVLWEQERKLFNIETAFRSPFSYLNQPADNGISEIHGFDIFSKTSLHLIKVYLGHVKPMDRTTPEGKRFKFIANNYSSPENKIKKIVETFTLHP